MKNLLKSSKQQAAEVTSPAKGYYCRKRHSIPIEQPFSYFI